MHFLMLILVLKVRKTVKKKYIYRISMIVENENFARLCNLLARYAYSTSRYLKNLCRDKSGPSITRHKKASATS